MKSFSELQQSYNDAEIAKLESTILYECEVCDHCGGEVRSVGPDGISVCNEGCGIVEGCTHYAYFDDQDVEIEGLT